MNNRARPILLVLGVILFIGVLYMAFNFIGALALGVFIYYCTRPIYRYLNGKGINKTISATVAQLAFIIPSILLVAYALQILAFEIRSFAAEASGMFADLIQGQQIIEKILNNEEIFGFIILEDQIEGISRNNRPQSLSDLISQIDTGTVDSIVEFSLEIVSSLVTSVSGLFFTIFIAFTLSFYLQRDGNRLESIVSRLIEYDRDTKEFIKQLDSDLKVVFLGNIALALATAVLGATSFYLITILVPGGEILKYPGLIGFLCGLASLIPVVGMKLVYFPVTVVISIVSIIQKPLPEALLFPTAFFVVGLVIVDLIPDLLARPYIGSWSGISTSILLFSYILGPLAFGWYGLFLGPLIFVAFYEFTVFILPRLIQEYESLWRKS